MLNWVASTTRKSLLYAHLSAFLDLALHLRVLGRRRDQSQYLDGRHPLVASVEAHRALEVAERTANVLQLLAQRVQLVDQRHVLLQHSRTSCCSTGSERPHRCCRYGKSTSRSRDRSTPHLCTPCMRCGLLKKQVRVQLLRTLTTWHCCRAPLHRRAIGRYLLQTYGRTPYRFLDPVRHIMRSVPINSTTILLRRVGSAEIDGYGRPTRRSSTCPLLAVPDIQFHFASSPH